MQHNSSVFKKCCERSLPIPTFGFCSSILRIITEVDMWRLTLCCPLQDIDSHPQNTPLVPFMNSCCAVGSTTRTKGQVSMTSITPWSASANMVEDCCTALLQNFPFFVYYWQLQKKCDAPLGRILFLASSPVNKAVAHLLDTSKCLVQLSPMTQGRVTLFCRCSQNIF